MKTILVCNQKGGVGKSLIADELAFAAERAGLAFNFYDLDVQGGTLHQTQEVEDAQLAIVDTAGALTEHMSKWISAADIVVIPTRTTSRDIAPLLRMKEIVEAQGKDKIVYVLNAYTPYRASRDFQEWFCAFVKPEHVYILPQSEMFVQAATRTQSVVAYSPKSKAASLCTELCDGILQLATE